MFAKENAEKFLFKNDGYVKYFEMTSTLLELWWWQSVLVEFLFYKHSFLSSIENDFSNLIF